MAGKQSAAYMEEPGVWVSSYNLLTVGIRYSVPLLLLVGYVGSSPNRLDQQVIGLNLGAGLGQIKINIEIKLRILMPDVVF
jgi:hypothetical protein